MRSEDQDASRAKRTVTLSAGEVRRALDLVERGEDRSGDDPLTRLAWRPAWSIRSRRGALAPFLDLFRRKP